MTHVFSRAAAEGCKVPGWQDMDMGMDYMAEGTVPIIALVAVQTIPEIPLSNKSLGNLSVSLLSTWRPNP